MGKRIPYRLNLGLAIASMCVSTYQLFVLPLLFLPRNRLWLLSLLPCLAASNSMWFLAHETFHGSFHPRREINDALGRILCVFFGAPFSVVRFGHLMHHRFNGSLTDRPDLYIPVKTQQIIVWIRYYLILFGGFYLQEFLCAAVFFQKKEKILSLISRLMKPLDKESLEIKEFALSVYSKDKVIRRVRIDGCFIYATFAASVVCYGRYWYWALLMLFAKGFIISFANNIAHYGTSRADASYALNLRLPRPLKILYLNFYCHRSHHRNPTIPWTQLPSAMRQAGDTFDQSFLKAAFAQLRGPLAVSDVDRRKAP